MTRWTELERKPADPLVGRLAGQAPTLFDDTILPARELSPAEHCADAFAPRSRVVTLDVPTPSSGETAGFLARCVRSSVARADGPVTAFDVARDVLKRHPNRWASSSVRKKCSDLAKRGVLREVDCEGVSLDHAPCWRYVLGEAA